MTLTPNTYLVPAEGAQLYVVELPGVYGVAGADVSGSTDVVSVTTTGIPSSRQSGVVVTGGPWGQARYVYLRRGDRLYARGWDASGQPLQTGVSLWLAYPGERGT